MRPAVLCKLEKGKVIDAQNGFVDTFNWMVDFINNLKGDGDLDRSKNITLDVSKDDHPVVRFKSGGFAVGGDGAFAPVCGGDDPDVVTALVNCYYQVGGRTKKLGDYSVSAGMNGVLALRYDATGRTDSASVQTYASTGAMEYEQNDERYVIVPLFVLEDGKVVVDMRRLPHVQVAEVL